MAARGYMVVQVRFSEEEWLALERMARIKRGMAGITPCPDYDETNLKHFRAFVNGSIHRMARSVSSEETIPEEILRPFNTFRVPEDLVSPLTILSERFHTTISSLVKRHVIHPLLFEYYDLRFNEVRPTLVAEPSGQH